MLRIIFKTASRAHEGGAGTDGGGGLEHEVVAGSGSHLVVPRPPLPARGHHAAVDIGAGQVVELLVSFPASVSRGGSLPRKKHGSLPHGTVSGTYYGLRALGTRITCPFFSERK